MNDKALKQIVTGAAELNRVQAEGGNGVAERAQLVALTKQAGNSELMIAHELAVLVGDREVHDIVHNELHARGLMKTEVPEQM